MKSTLALVVGLGSIAISASSFAMGRSSLVLVATFQSQAKTSYMPTELMDPCDIGGGVDCDNNGIVGGQGCESIGPMYSPSARDASTAIREQLKAQGYSDDVLKKQLYIEVAERGKVQFGGSYPSCMPSIDNVEFEAYLPKQLVIAPAAPSGN
jgi:hypothetical protein